MFIADARKEQRPRIDALTSMRFFAAMYVVLFHSTTSFAMKQHASKWLVLFLGHGYLAVSLFFILSGFVLTYNYAERWDKLTFRDFMLARLARIYPVYLFALLLQIPFYRHTATFFSTAAVLLMVQSWTVKSSELPGAWNYPSWTLSIELFFYLCFPLLLRAFGRIKASDRVLTALWITTLISIALDGVQISIGGRTAWLPAHVPMLLFRLPEFMLGMLLALYQPKKALSGRLALWLSLAAITLLLVLNTHRFVTLIIVPFAALLWLMANRQSRLRELLESKLLVLLGGASYSIYLLQEPVLAWLRVYSPWPLEAKGVCLFYLPALVFVGVIIFLGYEQPMRHWIRRYAANLWL